MVFPNPRLFSITYSKEEFKMSKEINSIAISGRLAADVKVLRTKEDKPTVVSVDLAVNKYSKTAPDHKKCEYYHVLAFGALAGRLSKATKGSAVIVNGELSVRDSQKDGITYRNTTIIASDFCYSHFPSNTADVVISGRMAKELRVSKQGNFAGFDLACDFYDLESKDFKPQFISVVMFNEELVKRVHKAVQKGYRLYIRGHMVSSVKHDEARHTTFTNQAVSIDSFSVLDWGKDTPKASAPASKPTPSTESAVTEAVASAPASAPADDGNYFAFEVEG